jgi:hypothetical protein
VDYKAYLDDELFIAIDGFNPNSVIPSDENSLKTLEIIERAKQNKNNDYVSLKNVIRDFVKSNSYESNLILPYLLGGPEVTIRVKNKIGDTVLHTLSKWNFAVGVKKLISLAQNFFKGDTSGYNGFINAKNINGSTALFHCQDTKTVKALIDAGIAMTDTVCACSVGIVRGDVCIDVTANEQNANGEVVAKLDELIGLMKSGGLAVNMDGSRVGNLIATNVKFRGTSGIS